MLIKSTVNCVMYIVLTVIISFNLNFLKHLPQLWRKYVQEITSLAYYGVLEKL